MIPAPNYEQLKKMYADFKLNLPKTEFERWSDNSFDS